MGSSVCLHPMLRGGPPVTLGLSPRIRSYSRMLTLAKETARRSPIVDEVVVMLLLEEEEGGSAETEEWRRLLRRDSCKVLEIMMPRGGSVGSDDVEGVRMRMVGAELVMMASIVVVL